MSKKHGDGSGTGPCCVVHAELLKLQKNCRFPDEPAKAKCAQADAALLGAARDLRCVVLSGVLNMDLNF